MTTNSLQNSPIKRWVLFPHPLDLGWLCDWFWPKHVRSDMFWGLGLKSHCDFCFTLLELGVHTMKKSEMSCHGERGPSSHWSSLNPCPRQSSAEYSGLSKTSLAWPIQPTESQQIMNHCCLMPLCFEVVCSTVIDNWNNEVHYRFSFFSDKLKC